MPNPDANSEFGYDRTDVLQSRDRWFGKRPNSERNRCARLCDGDERRCNRDSTSIIESVEGAGRPGSSRSMRQEGVPIPNERLVGEGRWAGAGTGNGVQVSAVL